MFSNTSWGADAVAVQAAPTQVAAADAPPAKKTKDAANKDEDSELGSVVVTAQRRKEKLQDVPVAITAIKGDTLLKADVIKTANDVTQFIPNAQAAATDGRTRPRWFLRGIGSNETAASTVSPIGIYNDDVFLNNVYIQGFPLFDIDHVEVLRGPQGTLWGKNTTGGAINFLSRKPSFDQDGYGKVTVGSFNEKIIQGAVGGSLVGEKVAGRVSFYDEKRDGWVDNIATGRKDGAESDSAIRAQFLFLPTTDIDVLLSLRTRRLDGDKSPSFLVQGPKQVVLNPIYYGANRGADAIAAAGIGNEKLDYNGATLTANWALGGNTLTSITARDAGTRVLFTPSALAIDTSRSYALSDSEQFTQELRLASSKKEKLSWIVGAHYFDESLKTNSVNRQDAVAGGTNAKVPGTTPALWNREKYDQDTKSEALFGSATYQFTDQLSLIGGVRRSREKKDYDLAFLASASQTAATFNGQSNFWEPSSVTSALLPEQYFSNSATWSNTTYDLTGQYKINANANTYIRYAHGFRAGGFVVDQPSTTTRGIKKLNPETLNATEIGLKTQWLDGRLTANTAVFNYDYKDKIEAVLLPVPGTATTRQVQENAASGYSRGVELELAFYPTSNFRVAGSFGYLDTKYENYSSTASGQTLNATGNRFTRSPRFSETLDAEYRFPLKDGSAIAIGTDWSYRTKQYFNAVDQTDPTLYQEGYALGNARITYQAPGDKLEITAFVRNVTDRVYSVLATGSATGTSLTREVYGLPRSYGLTASLKF